MAAKDWLIGTLRPDGYLKTESGKIWMAWQQLMQQP
jgi:hypothetical protein